MISFFEWIDAPVFENSFHFSIDQNFKSQLKTMA